MRVVFMGSPDFALPALQRLVASEHEVACVVTQPDRRAGRGRGVRPPPVKLLAARHGLPVLQPQNVNTADALASIRALEPDVLVVAAFGQILKEPLLSVPKRGSLNIHASLLPKFRGAAPVVGALLAGERETGVSIMEVELALDAGAVVAQRTLGIGLDENAGTLTAKLAELGGELLVDVLPAWHRREIAAQPQDRAQATYMKPVRPEDARIDWSLSADEVWRRVRAYNPWPAATTTAAGLPLRILEGWPIEGGIDAPGVVVPLPPNVKVSAASFAVQCGRGLLAVTQAQRAGRRVVTGAELLRGWGELLGMRLGA